MVRGKDRTKGQGTGGVLERREELEIEISHRLPMI